MCKHSKELENTKKINFQGLFHPGPNLQESWKIVVVVFFVFVFFAFFLVF